MTLITISSLLANPQTANQFSISVSKLLRSSYNNTQEKGEIKLMQQLYEGTLKVEEVSSSTVALPQKLSGKWGWPIAGKIQVNSPFAWRWGRMHEGVDLEADTGHKVLAARNGVVTRADWLGGYGKTVDINHGEGFSTRYAHNSKLLVVVGQQVKQGSVIALSGATGVGTGPHVHFEIRINGAAVNPLLYLK